MEENKNEVVKETVEPNVTENEDPKKKTKKKRKRKLRGLWEEFKKFINRGNVVDMSIGVVIGSAFGAIVTAVTNIFLSFATWGVPGGLKGLISVLPALNKGQAGLSGIGQTFSSDNLIEMAKVLFESDKTTYVSVPNALNTLTSKYTLYGGTYVYNGAAIIDWGALINATITFIVIALVLFIILKTLTKLNKMKEDAKKKVLDDYYKKHPDEKPDEKDPKLPEPTEKDLLKQILKEMQIQNGTYKDPKKK